MQDKFELQHKKAVTIVLVPAFVLSFLFITGAGLHILDIVDAFTNQIGIAVSGVLEVILIGWFFNPEKLRKEANSFSNFSIGKWWTWSLKIITVLVLGFMTVMNIKNFLTKGYGDYSRLGVGVFGWGTIAVMIIAAIIFTVMKGKKGYADHIPTEKEREHDMEEEVI